MRRISGIGSPTTQRVAENSAIFGRRGFTLIELLIVITIVVLLAGLFPLAVDRLVPARRFSAESRRLVSELRDLRSEAIASSQTIPLVFDKDHYKAVRPNKVEAESRKPRGSIYFAVKSADGQQILRELRLYPDGSTSGGRIELTDATRHATIVLSSLTGRITLAD